MVSLIIESGSLKEISLEQLGGKGHNLSILTQNDIPIPPWFCLTGAGYRSSIQPIINKIDYLLKSIAYQDHQMIQESSSGIRQLIEKQPIMEEIRNSIFSALERLGKDKLYSVRSSSLKEDSNDISFAGLFDTYLFVPGSMVIDKIIACWASLYSDRALSYFHYNHISPLEVDMAVIVQEMVDSTKSGILFQANPHGLLEESVIVAGYGLGEGVVGDQVETDTYYYNRLERTYQSVIGEKRHQLQFDTAKGFGITLADVPIVQRSEPILSQVEISQLISLSKRIENLFTTYQDIEWGISGDGQIYILQSRPITTIPKGDLVLYDNSNISENYPNITSILTFSILKKFYAQMYLATYTKIGFAEKHIKLLNIYFEDMINIIQGRVYYNLTNWYRVLSVVPGSSTSVFAYFEEMIGSTKSKTHEEVEVGTLVRLRVNFITWMAFLRWGNKFAIYRREFNRTYTKNSEELKECQYEDLGRIYNQILADYWKLVDIPCRNDYYVMLTTGIAKEQLMRLAPHEAADVFNALLLGNEGIESVDPLVSIIRMAEIARELPELRKALEDGDCLFDQKGMIDEFPEFYALFLRHLDKYGDRGPVELKLESKTFRQQPDNLIRMILQYAETDMTLGNLTNRRNELYKKARQQLDQILKNQILKRIYFKYIIKRVHFHVKIRESGRLDRTRFYGLLRQVILRIADKWVEDGILSEEEDIFFLNDDEIMSNLKAPNKHQIQEAVARRRSEWESYRADNPIDRMFLKGDINKNYIPQKDQSAGFACYTDNELQGLGCCPGIVTGEALILGRPQDTELIRDKILVTTNTDPGWVFWIMASKGLIVEKGNMLSHTAIIGRELGKPTIVSVPNATKRISQNSLITMDGLKGTIRIGPS